MSKTTEQKAPEYPKPLVRAVKQHNVFTVELHVAGDADAEKAAGADFGPVPVVDLDGPPQEYPKWVTAADGSQQIVNSKEEEDAHAASEKKEKPETKEKHKWIGGA